MKQMGKPPKGSHASKAFVISKQAFVPDHSLPDQVLTFPPEGGAQLLSLTLPYLPGMDELVVERAHMLLAGQPETLPAASLTRPQADSAHVVSLGPPPRQPVGRLVRICIEGFRLEGDDAPLHTLPSWETTCYLLDDTTGGRWGAADGSRLRFMLIPSTQDGWGPPAAAAPPFPMPGNAAGLYGPVLAGAQLRLGVPDPNTLTLLLNPPLDSRRVRIFLGASAPHQTDLPQEAQAVRWTARKILAYWSVAPREVQLQSQSGGAAAAVWSHPGELPADPAQVDFTPAARAQLEASRAESDGADPALAIRVTCASAGTLHITRRRIRAYYHHQATSEDIPVSLRGVGQRIHIPVPPGLCPAQVRITLDGGFRSTRLVAASDDPQGVSRVGFRVAGPARLARWMPLTAPEQGQPLRRVGIFGRASEEPEILLTLHGGDALRLGSPLGDPVALTVASGAHPRWRQVDIPPGVLRRSRPRGVWVVAQASRGGFWWHADLATSGPTQRSTDGGANWSTTAGRPLLQLHGEGPLRTRPIAVTWNHGPLTSDLLRVLPASQKASKSGVQIVKGALSASFYEPGEDAQAPTALDAPRFRVEDLSLFTPSELERFSDLGGDLLLAFYCSQDVDFRIQHALLTYNPWSARSS